MDLNIDLGPEQPQISEQRIQEMITWRPRRMQLSIEWPDALHEPDQPDKDWSLVLPFCETFSNTFNAMCQVESIGMRESKKGGRCFTFIKDESDEAIEKVREWLSTIGQYVVIRDCLALSFAIDYDKQEGNPEKPQTKIGSLRSRAKPYDGMPTEDTFVAAKKLIGACLKFIENIDCYKIADVVVAMPPSDPRKPFNLPAYLAAGIAKVLSKPDLTNAISTVSARNGLKSVLLENKLPTIEGTIKIDEECFKGKSVLLIDDLYQSGISMNYTAMLLLNAGATKVFGLACEKTCSNDDNVARRGR